MEELEAFLELSMRMRQLIKSQSTELKYLRIRVEELEEERNHYLQRCLRQ